MESTPRETPLQHWVSVLQRHQCLPLTTRPGVRGGRVLPQQNKMELLDSGMPSSTVVSLTHVHSDNSDVFQMTTVYSVNTVTVVHQ